MIAGDCSKSWRMHRKRLHRQAFFSIVVNGLPTGYWCSSGGCMSKSSWWRPCFFDTWPMNALEIEHSNLEIDSKLNRQPVKTYKWRCDVFMSWQWAHQSDCRVLHPLELAKVRSGNTIQWSILDITIAWTIDSIFKAKISFNAPNIMQMVKSWLTSLVDSGVFMLRWLSNDVPRFRTLHTADTSCDQCWALICLSCPTASGFRLQLIPFCHHLA